MEYEFDRENQIAIAIKRMKEQNNGADRCAKKNTIIQVGNLVKVQGHEQSNKMKIYSAKLTWKYKELWIALGREF